MPEIVAFGSFPVKPLRKSPHVIAVNTFVIKHQGLQKISVKKKKKRRMIAAKCFKRSATVFHKAVDDDIFYEI